MELLSSSVDPESSDALLAAFADFTVALNVVLKKISELLLAIDTTPVTKKGLLLTGTKTTKKERCRMRDELSTSDKLTIIKIFGIVVD